MKTLALAMLLATLTVAPIDYEKECKRLTEENKKLTARCKSQEKQLSALKAKLKECLSENKDLKERLGLQGEVSKTVPPVKGNGVIYRKHHRNEKWLVRTWGKVFTDYTVIEGQVVDERSNQIIRLSVSVCREPGTVAQLYGTWSIMQIVSESKLLLTRDGEKYLLTGVDTSRCVDGETLLYPYIVFIGRVQYEAVSGATITVPEVRLAKESVLTINDFRKAIQSGMMIYEYKTLADGSTRKTLIK